MLTRHDEWIKKFLYFIGIATLLLAGISACADSSASSTTSTAPGGPPITIGYSYSTSGDFAADGKAMDQGYQLWADTINNSGGILGRPVQFVKLTDNSDPKTVTANYQTLITKDHVNLVFGPFSSLLTIPASQVANKYGYALVEGSGGGPAVFQNNLKNVFDVSLPVVHNLDSFAYYILSLPPNQRPKTVAYATENTDPFTQPQVDQAALLLKQGGIQRVAYITDDGTPKEFAGVAQQLIQAHADMDVVGTFLPDVSAFIKAFKQAHYFPKAIVATAGPDLGQAFVQAVGGLSATEGVFVPNGWYPEASNFQNAQMVQNYLAKYGGSANGINADVAEAYSVGQIVQQAIEKIGNINNAALIQQLHSDTTFDSVQGAVKFDSTGQNLVALTYLFQWQKGSFLPVFPPPAAVQNPEYPNPQTTLH